MKCGISTSGGNIWGWRQTAMAIEVPSAATEKTPRRRQVRGFSVKAPNISTRATSVGSTPRICGLTW